MGEHDAARCGLHGELEQFFAVGVAAEFEFFNVSFDLGFNVGRRKKEGVALLGREELATGSIGVAVTDKADGIARVPGETRSEGVGGRALDQHARADDVEAVLLRIFARVELARRGLDLEVFDDAAREVRVLQFARDFVEVVGEIHAQPGGEDGTFDEFAELSSIVNDGEQFLLTAKCEDRDKIGTTALDGGVDTFDQTVDLGQAGFVGGTFRVSAGGFGDDCVEVSGGEFRAVEGALVFEEHVTGKEDGAVFIMQFHAGCSGDVTGWMEDDLDVVFLTVEFFGVSVREAGQSRGAAVDFFVREKRILGDVFFLFLSNHHVRGIVQHALDQHVTGLSHDDRRFRMFAHDDWKAADVIEMAVRDDDQIEAHAA